MNRLRVHRRSVRVVVRPKERARRARIAAVAAALGALGVVAFVTVRKLASDFASPLAARASGRADAALILGPEPLRTLAQAEADAMSGTAGEKAQALKARFACLEDVRVSRSWTEKSATLTLLVRRPLAAALRRGKPAGFLDHEGNVFPSPEGAFILTGPAVEVAGASSADLALLAREWPALTAAGAFPSPLVAMSFRSPEDGWQARLADGTSVLWGHMDWTQEKLSRLAEAVVDAQAKEPGIFSADLRWFEDGKVLLKPMGVRPGVMP
ncbi:MAG: cell division protein FtsQ/DivIB [Elusimicrobiota bacterium]